MTGQQLGLSLRLRDDATFGNFHAGEGNNRLVLQALQAALGHSGPQVIYLHGAPGSGRSHLLQALCHEAAQRQQTAIYLPLAELAAMDPAGLLHGLEQLDIVCLDDLAAVAGEAGWQEALFHAMNRLRDARRLLVVAAEKPPAAAGITLPDLQSRLAAATVFRLEAPADSDRRVLLQQRAAARGLVLDEDAAQFLLMRAPRGTGELLALLERLDQEALVQQRRLTIPFIKSVMQW